MLEIDFAENNLHFLLEFINIALYFCDISKQIKNTPSTISGTFSNLVSFGPQLPAYKLHLMLDCGVRLP